jgi:hypothetical protein
MERIASGERRARYAGTRLGPPSDEARAAAPTLIAALDELEKLGLAPVLDDGAVAGNGAMRLPGGTTLVSASARRPGEPSVVEIVSFDRAAFAIGYRSDEGREPTSDVALHLAVLAAGASASLHGHALELPEDAARLGLPIATVETTFGTREDLDAMEALLARAPFPAHRAWIRRGHGFVVAGASMDAARAELRALASRR